MLTSDLLVLLSSLPLWAWAIILLAIVLLSIVLHRLLEFEGINFTPLPTFRFKRRQSKPRDDAPLARISFGEARAADGNVQQVGTVGGDNIQPGTVIQRAEHVTIAPPTPSVSSPKPHVPAQTVEIYIRRGIEDQVRARLTQDGVAAIVGVHAPGGVGKTELAKYVARRIGAQFDATVWIILAEKTPEQVVTDLGRQCGAQFSPNADYAQRVAELKGHLQTRRLLIILDDVREKNRAALADFLPPSPPCAAIVTSRIRELSRDIPANASFPLDNMTRVQARELLDAAVGEALVRTEPDAVNHLIEKCKCNPLALDIAARRIRQYAERTQPIAFFVQKLEQRLDELKAGDDPHLNWEAVVDMSYDDLTPANQKRFRALSVFAPTGFSVPAAQFVWGDTSDDAVNAIVHLHNLSLLKMVDAPDERYRLHDLLDEYATKKLRESKEDAEANERHAQYLIGLFEKHYLDDPSTAPHVAMEIENLRLAVKWARAMKQGELLAELATKPRNWMVILSLFAEWYDWLRDALRIGKLTTELEANTLQAIGDVQRFRDENDAALASYQATLELFRAVGARLGEANVYGALSRLEVQKENITQAEKWLAQAVVLHQSIGDRYSVAVDYGNFAIVLSNRGDKQRAKEYAAKAEPLYRSIGSPRADVMKKIIEG